MGTRIRLLSLVAVLLLAAACGGTTEEEGLEADSLGEPVASEPNGSGPTDPDESVYQELAGTTDDSGTLSLDSALALFALQYGGLPDVEVPAGDPGPAMSGDLAVAGVLGHWEELTEAQRSTVLERLELPPDFTPAAPAAPEPQGPTGTVGRSIGRRTVADIEPYRRVVERMLAHQEQRFGPLGVSVTVVEGGTTYSVENGRAAADTLLLNPTTCRIRVFTGVLPPPDGPNFALAHEVAHCFQQVWTPQVWPRSQSWVIEGGANWVASQTVSELGGSDGRLLGAFLQEYVTSPGTPLFRRTYTGVGFFATVAEHSGALWDRIRPATEARGARASFEAVAGPLAGDPALASSWATNQTGRPLFGGRWVLDAAGIPNIENRSPLEYQPLTAGASRQATAPAYATVRLAADLRAPITRLAVGEGTHGLARVGDSDRDIEELRDTAWCTDPNGHCTCPSGTRRAGHQFPRLDGRRVILAMSGGDRTSALATLTTTTLEDECGKMPVCPVGEWVQTTVRMPSGTELISGGSGTRITIDSSGGLVQDFSGTSPMTTRSTLDGRAVLGNEETTTTTHLAPNGQLTARLSLPSDMSAFTSAPVEEVDASTMSGTAWIEALGTRVDISVSELMGIATSIAGDRRFASPTGPPEVRCADDGTLVLRAGNQEQVYSPADG